MFTITTTSFIIGFRKKPPRTVDLCSEYIQEFLEDVRMALESFYDDDVQMSEEEVDEKMEWVERYICGELYDRCGSFNFTLPLLSWAPIIY